MSQTRPPTQTRKSRSFSFRSDKSHSSNKIDLTETSAEKEAKRLHSKADPTLAMNEAEPSEVAATHKSSLAPLRSIQHRDANGNPIVEPDRSNPTRSRWERPLDTIRSFEAAIDGAYSNRRSMLRSDTESISGWGNNNSNNNNRRYSHYGNGNGGRYSHDSYYNSRPPSAMYSGRPDGGGSYYDLRHQGGPGHRDYYDPHGNSYTPMSQMQGRRGYARTGSEPHFPTSYRPGPPPNDHLAANNHRSYETVASASGSGSSADPAGYSTDPTSDNSSVERVQAPVKPQQPQQPMNDYGIGFSQTPTYQAPAFTVGNTGNANANGFPPRGANIQGGAPPPVPQKTPMLLQRQPTATSQQRPPAPEKRKSWFARRFSKHD